jgi:methyl-accepting chemotaxis protein
MALFRKENKLGVPPTYLSRIQKIVGSSPQNGELQVDLKWNSPEEARQHCAHIPQMQDELRQVKAEVNQHMKEIRSSFSERRAAVKPGPVAEITSKVTGKKRTTEAKAQKLEKLRHKQDEALAPYQATRDLIDRLLLQLDSLHKQVNAWLAQQD